MTQMIDKIVLSHGKDRCVVHLVNGVTLHFNFFKLGMTYIEGLKWVEEEVLQSVNNWRQKNGSDSTIDETCILKVA